LKNPKFFTPKSADVRIFLSCLPPCPKNVRTGQISSPLTAVLYGRHLSYDVIFTLIFVSLVQHSLSFRPRAATGFNSNH